MSYLKSKFRHPDSAKNKLGYTEANYEGALSTLCAGCGHDCRRIGVYSRGARDVGGHERIESGGRDDSRRFQQ